MNTMPHLQIRYVLIALLLLQASVLAKVPMLANGNRTGYYIGLDSTLYSWGLNNHGQLGNGTRDTQFFARRVDHSKWIWVGSLDSFALALKADSTLWSWGQNNFGQLGLGDTLERLLPTQVGSAKWRKASVGYPWCLGIQADSSLWSWGKNSEYNGSILLVNRLGLTDSSDHWTPTRIGSSKWLDASAGGGQGLALGLDSLLWGWGDNFRGNLGDTINPANTLFIQQPTRVGGSQKWLEIWAAPEVSMMRALDSTIWGFGTDTYAMLGMGGLPPILLPVKLVHASPSFLVTGPGRSLDIAPDSSLWSWGDDIHYSDYLGWYAPGSIKDYTDTGAYGIWIDTAYNWVSASIGMLTSSALRSDGSIFWWGKVMFSDWNFTDDPRTTKVTSVANMTLFLNMSGFGKVYFDTATVALPVLATHGMKAKMFVQGSDLIALGSVGEVSVYNMEGRLQFKAPLVNGHADLSRATQGMNFVRLPDGRQLIFAFAR